ncbi:hypothetical protein RQP46_006477 [Phenoliferia psychrophenolica]
MSFETKIERGGTGFLLDAALGGAGIWMFVVGSLPEGRSFVNHNHDLLPKNSITLATGFGLVQEITNGGHPFESIPITSMVIEEGIWLNVSINVTDRSRYSVFINSHLVLSDLDTHDYDDVPAFNDFFGAPTVGLGPWADQAAYFRNLHLAHSAGETFYFNPLDSEEAFAEFGVAVNEYDRDRLIWTGDFYPAALTIAVTTWELEFLRGTIDFSFDYRLDSGAIPTSNPMGIRREHAAQWSAAPSTLYTDYSMDLLNVAYEYFFVTGDLKFIRGSGEGTSSGCMLVYTLNNLAKLADALDDVDTATAYRAQARKTAVSVQRLLFDDSTGAFHFSLSNDAFAFIDFAWTILSGVATPTQIKSQLKHLEELKYKIGYLQDSNAGGSSSTVLAPYLSSYLLEALLQAGAEAEAEFLLDGIFGAMATPSKDFSGTGRVPTPHGAIEASWELDAETGLLSMVAGRVFNVGESMWVDGDGETSVQILELNDSSGGTMGI